MNIHKRHKILFISSWFPNKLEPTNGNFVQRHAEAVSLLHDVEVLHAIGDFNQKEKFVFDDEMINGIRTLIVYYKNSKNPLQNFLRRMKAYQLGFKKMQKPDLVHGNVLHNNMLFAVSLKRKYGIPFVISEHWSGFLSKQNRKTIALAKIIAKNAELVIPVSKELKKGLQLNGIVKEANVIGNVIDTDLFCISQEAKDQFIFLHISNLIPLKNSEKIIKVASKLYEKYPHFQLQIGGDGDVEKLKNWVKKYKAEVFTKTFGLLSHKEVAKKMQQSSCFVLFSDMETQGIVLLESLSTGIPVIATNVGGIPEIVDKKRGILVENNNEDALFEAMKSMLEKNVELDSSEDLRKYVVENFSKSVIAEKFSEIYKQVLS